MISVAIVQPPAVEVEEPPFRRGTTLVLADRQRDFVETFIDTRVPKRSRSAFRVSMLSKLAQVDPATPR
jgi:hypothetical protein